MNTKESSQSTFKIPKKNLDTLRLDWISPNTHSSHKPDLTLFIGDLCVCFSIVGAIFPNVVTL